MAVKVFAPDGKKQIAGPGVPRIGADVRRHAVRGPAPKLARTGIGQIF